MNKQILLGHPSYGLVDVQAYLKQPGLQAALPSKRDGWLPIDIADILCQAYEYIAISDAMSEKELAPLRAGTVWHGLAQNLLLGNLLHVLPYGAPLGEAESLQLFRQSVKQRQKEMPATSLRILEAALLTARSGRSDEARLRKDEASPPSNGLSVPKA